MKKILISMIMLMIPCNAFCLSLEKEDINVDNQSSLTLNYLYDDYKINGNVVKLYYIASQTEDYQYKLSTNFSNYPIEVNGLKSEQEWESLKETLNYYIIADKVPEELSYPITNNQVKFLNLKPGLYFIKTDNSNNLIFTSFLINVPEIKEDGTLNYDVIAYPKIEEHIPKYEEINYKVVKEWQDDQKNRPQSINVEIYKNNILEKSINLSNDNNWFYEWSALDDGSTWSIIERNVPDNYNVSINKNNNTFIVLNRNIEYLDENPNTSDTIGSYFYFFRISLVGIILLGLYFILQKKKVK